MENTLAFVREALTHYKKIGSPVPSSSYLARAMIEALGPVEPGVPIVELGPGTGSFTRHLVKAYPENPLLGVEWCERFAELLRGKYPGLRIEQRCASDLRTGLRNQGIALGSVGGILSGLPLASFNDDLRQRIFSAVYDALAPGARYVQFTYHKFVWDRLKTPGLERCPHRRVWRNFPPAFVLTFRKTATPLEPTLLPDLHHRNSATPQVHADSRG